MEGAVEPRLTVRLFRICSSITSSYTHVEQVHDLECKDALPVKTSECRIEKVLYDCSTGFARDLRRLNAIIDSVTLPRKCHHSVVITVPFEQRSDVQLANFVRRAAQEVQGGDKEIQSKNGDSGKLT